MCLSPAEALAYVQGSPGQDEIRARWIQAHLDDCDRCRMVMAEAVRSLKPGKSEPSPSLRTLREGQCLQGRYRIRGFLGRGGMGEVYEAFDSVLNERIALKTLLMTSVDDRRAIERLLAEVRLARRVSHPNVCRILEHGTYRPDDQSGEELPFLTMQFLEGQTLARRITERGRLPLSTVSALAADLLAGLGAIHGAGIVHRDFKSQNVILVQSPGGLERAVIMDFGLARSLGDEGNSSTGGAGTPEYMAPEQIEGKPPTRAVDLYALGVVLYEMLTGERPFSGTSPYMSALSRLKERAPAPSKLAPELVKTAWDTVVGRCLERHPEDRYASVQEVERALARPRPPSKTRLRALAVAAAAAGLAALGAGAFRAEPQSAAPVVSVAATPSVPEPSRPAPLPPPPPPVAVRPVPAEAPPSRAAPPRPRRRERPAEARPAGAAALLREAEARLLEGQAAGACELAEQVALQAPTLAPAHLLLGKCYVRLGEAARARSHYRRYLELAPDAPDAVFVRAMLVEAK